MLKHVLTDRYYSEIVYYLSFNRAISRSCGLIEVFFNGTGTFGFYDHQSQLLDRDIL